MHDPIKAYYNRHATEYGVSSTRQRNMLSLFDTIAGIHVLDVGCANGIFGGAVKEKGAKLVHGVDISPQAVDIARKKLDGAWVRDIEREELPDEIASHHYDVIVLAEILEHLFDPAAAIKRLSLLLNPRGVMIVTTPNFLLWTHRVRLLLGQFQYTNHGYCDRGHIHFFSYQELLHTVASSGMRLIAHNNIYHPNWLQPIGPFRPSLFAFQFIWKIALTTTP